MNSGGVSPLSFFSDERQVDARTMDHITGYSGSKSDGTSRTEADAPSPLENRLQLDSQMAKGFVQPDHDLNCGQDANLPLGKHIIVRAASHCMPRGVDHDLGSKTNLNMDSASYFFDGDNVNLMGAQNKNGLFSSSFSDLFSRKLKVSSNNAAYSHSADGAAFPSHYVEEEVFESLEEIEAQTIGNLLPDDDDLFSGVIDGFGRTTQSHNVEDMEDLDLFSSVGGIELGEDGFSQRSSEFCDASSVNQLILSAGINGSEHPFGEYPSRTLFVRNINSTVEDSELLTLFEQFGDIRVLYTACKLRGFVVISYYDLRAARYAMKSLQNKPLKHRKLDIRFSVPKNSPDRELNQGNLVVFNLDSSVSKDTLRSIFGVYGEIKEIRGTPHISHHKVVEFYDTRAADSALLALNRIDIAGKQIKVEPEGSKRSMQPFSSELEQQESGLLLQQHGPSNNFGTGYSANGGLVGPLLDNMVHPGVSSSLPKSLPSLVSVETGNQSSLTECIHLRNHPRFELRGMPNLHPHSLPEYHDGLSNNPPFGSPNNMAVTIDTRPLEIIDSQQQFRRVGSNKQSIELNEVFGSPGNGSCPLPGQHYMWNSNSHHPQPKPIFWPGSPSFVNGIAIGAHSQQLHGVPRAPSHMLNSVLPLNNHHVGSAPSVNPSSLWDRRHAYAGESPEATTVFHPGSPGNMRISGNSPHPLEFVPRNIFPRSGPNYMDVPISSKNIGLHPHHQRCMVFPATARGGQMLPMTGSLDSPNERTRNRRNEGNMSPSDNKKQFELDLDRILRGDDNRTTLMIKNIPNKYSSKMLLAAIDEHHRGTYDFIYLPIDFKNKCNVGYAFINMTEPALIVPFYQTINGKRWEKFNSEKVAYLAYARIQGKKALVAHFQNSSLMNEDKRCRPILFHTDGPNAGDQIPFPMGPNIRSRHSKTRTRNRGIPSNSLTGEECSNGDSSPGSGKDSD